MTNAFHILADRIRDLSDQLVVEIGLDSDGFIISPRAAALVGSLAALIHQCEQTASLVGEIKYHDAPTAAALEKAVEKTMEKLT